MAQKENAPAIQMDSQSAVAAHIVATAQQFTNCSHFHSIGVLRYTAAKPKGSVLENTILEAVAAPTFKRGFVMPKFCGLRRLVASTSMVSGGMGLSVRTPARLRACFQHPVHLMRLKTQTVAYLGSLEGIQTMTALTKQASSAAKSTPTTGTLATTQITTLLAAFNAANMASSYIERGNFAAARRKLVLALASVNQLAEG